MGALSDRMRSSETLLRLDWLDYAERLLCNGRCNWRAPAEAARFLEKAHTLLPGDILLVPADRIAQAHCSERSGLAQAMTDARGDVGALEHLLDDADYRGGIAETLASLRTSAPFTVLGLPSPGAFSVRAAEWAGAVAPAIDDDLCDDAALAIADFVRSFSQAAIAGVCLGSPAQGEDAGVLGPIARTIDHYQWDLIVSDPAITDLPDNAVALHTIAVPADFWAGGALGAPLSGLIGVTIPADAEPEAVLAALRRLRETAS